NQSISRNGDPKPNMRLVRNDGPASGLLASIVTLLLSSSCDSCTLLANDGTWVEKYGALGTPFSLGYLMAVLKVPWIESPVEEISLTLRALTCARNVGLYGIRT